MKFPDLKIIAQTKLSQQVRDLGLEKLSDCVRYVQALPYGRTSDRSDLSSVLREQCGTCSSKHALIKQLALEQGDEAIVLVIGLYKMSRTNTPGIGDVLEKKGLEFVPEAHCYLKIGEERLDITTAGSSFELVSAALLEEQEIEPLQIGAYKVAYHQAYLKNWVIQEGLPYSFEEVWKIREACIHALSN